VSPLRVFFQDHSVIPDVSSFPAGFRICEKRENINILQQYSLYLRRTPWSRRGEGVYLMRFIIECWIPAENGNCSLLDGTMPVKIKKYLDTVKPEAVYFTIKDGQRTMIAVINIPSEDKMVAMMEPLWLDWGASVTCTLAMSLEDLEKAGRDMEKLAKERS
jgi:hypothetical protein